MQLLTSPIHARSSRLMRVLILLLSVACVCGLLAQTVLAQNTYVIKDGDQVTVHTTYATDPDKILSEAGVDLSAEDFYTTGEEDGVAQICVQRAMEVSIDHCGTPVQVNSYGESLEALLDRMAIPSEGDYSVSVPLSTQTYDGMQVRIDHTVNAQETYTAALPYEITYCDDPTLALGEEKILTPGQDGSVLRTDAVVYVNTQEQSRTTLEETVTQQPVNQVVLKGTGENVGGSNDKPIIGDGVIILPTGEVLTYNRAEQFRATAYTKTDDGCDDYTATGSLVHWGVVAVDPSVIPYGTRMYIVSNDGAYYYGLSTAEDCGGSIIGNRLDLYMETDPECWQFGVRDCTVYFLGDANWRHG